MSEVEEDWGERHEHADLVGEGLSARPEKPCRDRARDGGCREAAERHEASEGLGEGEAGAERAGDRGPPMRPPALPRRPACQEAPPGSPGPTPAPRRAEALLGRRLVRRGGPRGTVRRGLQECGLDPEGHLRAGRRREWDHSLVPSEPEPLSEAASEPASERTLRAGVVARLALRLNSCGTVSVVMRWFLPAPCGVSGQWMAA
mmetsp:Transcript_53436/g.148040  ORF Transcript_53436/g.148040 Transcript_53436/m.148040 type:complete len:203 (+) Transcript_53436:955-1563(+)